MKNVNYNMAFVAASLMVRETVIIAEQFILHRDWVIVRNTVLSKNLLQARTVSTGNRIYREIAFRLQTLAISELQALISAAEKDKACYVWLAVCRRHLFIAEFVKEIIHVHIESMDPKLEYEDFDSFFNKKAQWNQELECMATSTRKKIRQVLFRMLREADFLTKDNSINMSAISPVFLRSIFENNPEELLLFPVSPQLAAEYKR